MGKGPAAIWLVLVGPFVIAFFLCVILDAPFLVTLSLGALSGLLYFMAKKSIKQLSKTNLVEIYDSGVAIAIDGKLESFSYSEIKDFKLVEGEGLFKDGIYVIFTDEALEWRLASNASYAMKKRYEKIGTIAVIPTFASSIPIETVYSTLKKQLEVCQNSHHTLTHADDDPVADFIDDVDEILDAVEEGYAEGERIANRISKILKK